MLEMVLFVLFLTGVLLLISGGTQKKRSPAPSIKPTILESEDYKFDAIADLCLELSDDAKRRLIKHLGRQLKRSKFAKLR